MMERLRQRIGDPKLLQLTHRYLKAGVIQPDGTFEETRLGVPQGGPLSPLLANVLLDELDHELEARGHEFTRYADELPPVFVWVKWAAVSLRSAHHPLRQPASRTPHHGKREEVPA